MRITSSGEALRQYTLRLEQELASSKQSIAVAQQEAAKRDEAMKQVRKERVLDKAEEWYR